MSFGMQMYGSVSNVKIMRDPDTLVSSGLAYVTFGDVPSAQTAALRMRIVYGRPVVASMAATSRAEPSSSSTRWEPGSCSSTSDGSIIPAGHPPHPALASVVPVAPPNVQLLPPGNYPMPQYAPPHVPDKQGPGYHWEMPPPPIAAVPSGIPPFYGPAMPAHETFVNPATGKAGPVNINGTVFFEPPSQKDLEQIGPAEPWAAPGPRMMPGYSWM